jgi:hypothetical protein
MLLLSRERKHNPLPFCCCHFFQVPLELLLPQLLLVSFPIQVPLGLLLHQISCCLSLSKCSLDLYFGCCYASQKPKSPPPSGSPGTPDPYGGALSTPGTPGSVSYSSTISGPVSQQTAPEPTVSTADAGPSSFQASSTPLVIGGVTFHKPPAKPSVRSSNALSKDRRSIPCFKLIYFN